LTLIDAAVAHNGGGFRELWEYRDLLAQFIRREIQLRYRQTAAGMAWALLQPLSIMLVLSVFASAVGAKPGAIPYPLFTISGLVPWMYFTHAFTKTTYSLVAQSGILTEIYFPRLIVPLAAALGGAMDFVVAALLIPLFMIFYGVRPSLALAALPVFVAMALATALAMGLWLAVLNVKFKDIANGLPFLMQLMFFATPIAYPLSALPRQWKPLVALNPMTGVVEGFRWCILGAHAAQPDWSIAVSSGVLAALLIGGIWFFRRQEPAFIDKL
jgi:lipopolysaccharide transport system permease protein